MNLPADPRTMKNQALTLSGGRSLGARYADFLPEAQAIAEREAAPLARTLILVVALMFSTFLLWAFLAEVEQVAAAPGVIRPAGKVKIINHPTGGRVAKLLVAEGSLVKAGQPLLEFDPEVARQDIRKRADEWQSLSAEASRLAAEVTGKPLVFDPEIVSKRPDLVRTQRQIFRARRQSSGSRRATAERIVDQRRSAVSSRRQRLRTERNTLAILRQQESSIKQLAEKGYFPKLKYLTIKRQLSEQEGVFAEARENLVSAKSALAEAKSRLNSVTGDQQSDVLTQLNEARGKRDRANASLAQVQALLRNLQLRAPTDGVVKDIAISGAGQAIRPNEEIMKIIPGDGQLIVEARVSNTDIGYITPGQEASVKIRTYDFVRYGSLKGVVDKIAADASQNSDTGQLWFSVTIRTEKSYLGSQPGELPVTSGMEADVDLVIGKRTIISFLTDRLQRTARSALRER